MLLEVMTDYRCGSGEWQGAAGGFYCVGDAELVGVLNLCASDMDVLNIWKIIKMYILIIHTFFWMNATINFLKNEMRKFQQ